MFFKIINETFSMFQINKGTIIVPTKQYDCLLSISNEYYKR